MRSVPLFLYVLSLFLRQSSSAHNHRELAIASAASATASSSCRDDDAATVNCDIPIRGDGNRGGVAADDGVDGKTRSTILRFLDSSSNKTAEDYSFRVQGMRWHFMSLLRDAKRLEQLAKQLRDGDDKDGCDDILEQAANYVVNFNMAGFFRIQTNLFIPFLREHLCGEDSIGPYIDGGDAMAETDAFKTLVGRVEAYQVQSETIGKVMYEKAKDVSKSSNSEQYKQQLLGEISRSSRQLIDQLAPLRILQETLLVPAISRVVPSRVQKSFNTKVLLKLGLLESRVHLVGMRDAVWESGIDEEKKTFEEEIPYVARAMIERWRRSLYIPKAGALDYDYRISV